MDTVEIKINAVRQAFIDYQDRMLAFALNKKISEIKELRMEMTGNVVIEKQTDSNKALQITCPECGAPKGSYCDPERSMIHASRIAEKFAEESKPLTGPHEE